MYHYKAFHRFIIRFCSSSRSIRLPLKSLPVSRLALCQVPQRLLSRLIACRFLDALLPSAVVCDGEIVPPLAHWNSCYIGALMVPSLELGAIFLSRQLTIAFLLNVLDR